MQDTSCWARERNVKEEMGVGRGGGGQSIELYCDPAGANIESSEVWGTSCLLKKLIDLISRQFSCGKCPKPWTIQYLSSGQDGGVIASESQSNHALLSWREYPQC